MKRSRSIQRRVMVIVALLSSPLYLYAQESGVITGEVVEATTQVPIPGATVRVTGTNRGAAADLNGVFRIEGLAVGSYQLEISSIGFRSTLVTDVVVTNARPATVRVELTEQQDTGSTIVIRPDYFRKSREVPTSTQTLSNEEIRRLPGGFEDVVRAVSTLPGVAQVSNGRNDLLVRGGAPSENLYLIDGIESPNINHFGTQGAGGGPLSFVNLDFVRETTFSTGGFGAKYGDKVSSVLQLDLRKGREDRSGGKATISASQFGLNLEGPLTDRGSYIFSARRSYLDLIFRAAGFSFVPEYWDFFGKVDYRLTDRDQLSALAITAIDRVRFFNDDQDDLFDNARILDNSQNQLIAGLTWKHLFENGYVSTTLGRTLIDYEFGQSDTLGVPIFANSSTEDELNLRVDGVVQLGGETKTDLSFGGNAKTIGFSTDLTLTATEPNLDLDLEDRFQKAALYASLSREFFTRLRLTIGGRLDWFDAIEEPLYPAIRGAATLGLTDRLSLSLSGGRYHQSPSSIWLVANEENRKLKAISTDVGVVGIEQILADDFKVSAEGYVKQYSDYPASLSRPYLVLANTGAGFGGEEEGFASFGLEPLASLGTGQAWGVELYAQKKLSESRWYGVAALSLNNGVFTAIDDVERPSNFDQRVIFNLSGGWKISDLWEAGIKFRLATGRPYTPVDSTGDPTFGYQRTDLYNSERLGLSHQLDIRVDRRWPLGGADLITYIDIQNVYNRQNPAPPRYNERLGRGEVNESIGILPTIGVSLEW